MFFVHHHLNFWGIFANCKKILLLFFFVRSPYVIKHVLSTGIIKTKVILLCVFCRLGTASHNLPKLPPPPPLPLMPYNFPVHVDTDAHMDLK